MRTGLGHKGMPRPPARLSSASFCLAWPQALPCGRLTWHQPPAQRKVFLFSCGSSKSPEAVSHWLRLGHMSNVEQVTVAGAVKRASICQAWSHEH